MLYHGCILFLLLVLGLSPVAAEQIFGGPMQISENGVLFVDAKRINLSGANVPSVSAMCGVEKSRWPCGNVALGALKSFVGNKDVICVPMSSSSAEVICFVEGKDLSLWMLSEGWAVGASGCSRPYASASSEAASMRKGIWRDGGKPPKEPWGDR